jgi:hypothetical protein
VLPAETSGAECRPHDRRNLWPNGDQGPPGATLPESGNIWQFPCGDHRVDDIPGGAVDADHQQGIMTGDTQAGSVRLVFTAFKNNQSRKRGQNRQIFLHGSFREICFGFQGRQDYHKRN